MTGEQNHPAAAYVAFYESLTPETVGALPSVVHETVYFQDPFNEVNGIDAYADLLKAMFAAAPDIRFTVHNCAYDGEACFLRWTSKGVIKKLGPDPWIVEGMSELRFAEDGRVLSHVDFWDASTQFYARLPLIGGLIRLIRRRVGSH